MSPRLGTQGTRGHHVGPAGHRRSVWHQAPVAAGNAAYVGRVAADWLMTRTSSLRTI